MHRKNIFLLHELLTEVVEEILTLDSVLRLEYAYDDEGKRYIADYYHFDDLFPSGFESDFVNVKDFIKSLQISFIND